MSYILINRNTTRTEFADNETIENRFIHNVQRKTRKLGAFVQPVIQNQFTIVNNVNVADPSATIPLLSLSSAKCNISAPNETEAKAAWNKLKSEIDQAFAEQKQVFKGLPLEYGYAVNN